ncbi:MAG: hypothetical protein DME25_16390 [Verrucomicrobia bacterium]|nr:MAG: hypothetical protein DME25_16390 [Verrucomicrobiota bacterium]
MHTANFDEALDQIVRKDPRYLRGAYLFVREALDHTQKMVGKGGKSEPRHEAGEGTTAGKVRHVTGQELLGGIRACALEQFGPMALFVLQQWGVHRCEDFGEIVFNMVENSLLAKTSKDSRQDFQRAYDFDEAFRKPFLPASRPTLVEPEPKATPL